MNGDMYEIIAIAMRYFFAALMALIAIRAIRITVVDSRRATQLRRMSPETGRCGEFVVVTGEGRARQGMRYPVIREGLVGSSRKADVRVRSRSVRRSHAFFELTERGLRVRSNNHAPMYVGGKSRRETILRDGDHITVGHVELLLVLTVPVAAPEGEDMDMFAAETAAATGDGLFDLPSESPAPRRPRPVDAPAHVRHEKAPEPDADAAFREIPRAPERERAYAGPFRTPAEESAPETVSEPGASAPDGIFSVRPSAPRAVRADDPLAPEPNDEFDRWLSSTDEDVWDDASIPAWDEQWDDGPRNKSAKKRRAGADDPDDLFHI